MGGKVHRSPLRGADFVEVRDRAVESLQALVRIPTVSDPDPAKRDPAPFERLLATMRERYPLIHDRLEQVDIGGNALLFRWAGKSAERPVVLMAHLDVVPVDPDAPWTHPAYGGEIHDGAIWGRGTLDDKGCVVGIAEAVEALLGEDFTPAHDVWLSFGSTEEVAGETAERAVDELERRGVAPWFVVDEGGAIAYDAFPGVAASLGVVGVAEKGTTGIDLRVDGRGGHSSTPAKMDAVARLARAITRLDASPMPIRLPDASVEMLGRLGPHAPLPLRPVLANAATLKPALARALAALGPEPAAMTRTTIAVTMLSGSPARNVIASTAKAGLNVRVIPGDTVDDVVEHITRVVADDRVQVSVVERGEASPVSPVDDDAFELIEGTIAEVFPESVPTPYVMMAATDSRFFYRICSRVYRFAPFRMSKAQRQAIHSYDEHLGVDDLGDGVVWYRRLIERIPR